MIGCNLQGEDAGGEPPCGGGHPEQLGGAVRQEGEVQGRRALVQAGAGNQVRFLNVRYITLSGQSL